MVQVEPVPSEPAALATVDDERTLLVADYHAGVEAALRYERGVQVPSQAESRRDRLLALLERTDADRLAILGDLMHSIGDPGGAERGELEVLFESLPPVAVTLVKGNHDGAIESWLADAIEDADSPRPGGPDGPTDLEVVPGAGTRLGDLGVCHGHSWPATEALEAETLCMGHEHPCVRLEDEVGGSRIEPVWVRGALRRSWARGRAAESADEGTTSTGDDDRSGGDDGDRLNGELVVLPAFNELVGGTWINVADQSFLSPMLPDGLDAGEAYLLDGTRLGPYESV
ncbi:metallophosphoesterase [Halovivax limisalsi]|uniref:metallophosphoesterase n=1 Tax=Halovivax limisalsi TaxID=1453760 RepID=UPI001FFC6951|nr:metallophosphoesterase [Halovivax limisalsi]